MPMNADYRGPIDLPGVIPVFPLPGALLLPRGQMPLNIFEPRYLAMIDDSLRDGHRMIGMIQPDSAHAGPPDKPPLYKIGCVGRITQLAESGDGRYLLELTGVSRFRIEEELTANTAYRQCRVTYAPFADDFVARKGEDAVDRKALLRALNDFMQANDLKADWEDIDQAPNEALVNALSMMSPYGPAEKHRNRACQEEHRRRAAAAVNVLKVCCFEFMPPASRRDACLHRAARVAPYRPDASTGHWRATRQSY
jgi:Lon protease-like protein